MNLQESIRKDLDRLNEAPLEVTKQKISYELIETEPTYIEYEYRLHEEETEKWIEELGHIPTAEEIKNYMLNNCDAHQDSDPTGYGDSTYKIKMFVDGNEVEEYKI